MPRKDKHNYYLDIAETVLEQATCLRKKFGAVIVKNDEIISTGYNGAPRGCPNCTDMGYCTRERLKIPSGERYELCRSVHAEANCIISASRRDMIGADLYLSCHNASDDVLYGNISPCSMCRRLIINSGLSRVILRRTADEYEIIDTSVWITDENAFPYK